MKDVRTLAERLYEDIRDLAKTYRVNFRANDWTMISFVDFYLDAREELLPNESAQERYDGLKKNIFFGLIYVLKIIEKIKQENSSWDIKFRDYSTERSAESEIVLKLDYGKIYAKIEPGTAGTIVTWFVTQDKGLTSFVKNVTWLMNNDMKPDKIIASVQSDFNFIKDHLYNL